MRVVADVVYCARGWFSRWRGPRVADKPGRSRSSNRFRFRGRAAERCLALLGILTIALSIGGCAIVDAEKNNRGGFLDEIADDVWMKADSKKMRALRAVALEASLARIAMISPKSAPDRDLLARRIGETTKRADIVRRCAFLQLRLAGQLPGEPCFFFDSVMVDYENALFDLALVSLPIDEVKSLISRVSGGIASVSVNPLQLVQALLDIGREAFRYGRVVGAIYRDTLELEVQVWLTSPGMGDSVGALAAVYQQGNDNIPAWRAAIAQLRAGGLEPVPDQRFIAQLYSVIAYVCGQIVKADPKDPIYRDCAQPDLTKTVPSVAVSGTNMIFSPIGSSGGTGAAAGSAATQQLQSALDQERQQRQALQQQVNDLNSRMAQQQRLALNDTEQKLRPDTLVKYKAALCVKGPDAARDIFDNETRDRLREFASGVDWAPEITPSPIIIDANLQNLLIKATKISPACGATSVARNAYELGVFTQAGTAAADTEMQSALKFFKLNDTLRGRPAMNALRAKFQPQAALSGDTQLDPAFWDFIKRGSRCSKLQGLPTLPGGGRVQSDCPA